ncbi:MAG: S8 family serine peptidase, partial [Candidatus Eremiobacteraeota bacterium]|nr:S8 family serine peptidase [Candidatus Eremiobacteraeota bacterium]
IPACMREKFGGELVRLKLREGMTTAEGIAKMEKVPGVVYAESNDILSATEDRRVPDDLGSSLWGLNKIQAPEAWAQVTGSDQGPLVAIVDSGIDLDHPDLVGNLWNNPGEVADGRDNDRNGVTDDLHGYNAIDRNGNPDDDNSHGSHVAGTIAAQGNNGQGVVGVNWDGRLMATKFLAANGKGTTAAAIRAINYASENGARLANHSWGSEGGWGNRSLRDAMASSPMLHLVAAGNETADLAKEAHYPAAFNLPNQVTVAATDWSDNLADFSNYGEGVHLAAPGTSIYSTEPGGRFGYKSGTSMATPHVTGVAALIASRYPQASNEEIRKRLLSSVDIIDGLRGSVETSGRLNALKAVENDTQAPAPINSLRGWAYADGHIGLGFTATGDDGTAGRASSYDLRSSSRPLSERNFDDAHKIWTGVPAESGAQERLGAMVFPSGEAQQIHFGLVARDNVGNQTPLTTTSVTVPASRVAFDDDMDGRSSDWTGDWTRVSEPGRGKVWCDSEGKYDNGVRKELVSPVFDLGNLRGAKLTFDARYELERNRDRVALEVRRPGGEWSLLESYTGNSAWTRHQLDLSSMDGGQAQLRFVFTSDESVQFDGFSLDRVVVSA